MASTPPAVRPTLRCLDDLGVPLPDVSRQLNAINHAVIASAQRIPERRDAGGAERVLALSDRVWFKVKTGVCRGAVTELRGDDLPDWVLPGRGSWWLAAAGRRQADSGHHDFYAVLERECTTGRTVSSLHLLPADKDWKRFALEQAYAWRIDMKQMVLGMVAASLKSGQAETAEFRQHRITALVRAENGHDGYLAIAADGVPDPEVFALLLNCVPGVASDDWQPEPSTIDGIKPSSGQIVWSTLFPPAIARHILGLAGVG